MADPVTVTEIKSALHIEHADDDTLITDLIASATIEIERMIGGPIINAAKTEHFDSFPAKNFIQLLYRPVVSITSVKYTDSEGTQTTFTDWIADTKSYYGRVVLGFDKEWPSATLYPANPIEIVYQAGYGAAAINIPAPIKRTIIQIVSKWYESDDQEKKISQGEISRISSYLPMRAL